MQEMKRFTASIFLVHAFFLLSLPTSQCRVFPMDEQLIESTCRQTPNYDLCVSSLKSDPKSSTADVPGLALILVNIIKSKATETLNQIDSLLKGGPGAGKKQALDSCHSKYDAILEGDVPQAIEALTKGNYKFAQDGSNDAANEANSCESGFASGSSPLTDTNKYVHDVSAIAAAIVSTLL